MIKTIQTSIASLIITALAGCTMSPTLEEWETQKRRQQAVFYANTPPANLGKYIINNGLDYSSNNEATRRYLQFTLKSGRTYNIISMVPGNEAPLLVIENAPNNGQKICLIDKGIDGKVDVAFEQRGHVVDPKRLSELQTIYTTIVEAAQGIISPVDEKNQREEY